MTWPLSGGTATVATGRDVSVPSFREQGLHTKPRPSLSVGHSELRRMTDKIGIPTKAPQELPLPAPCVGLLILPMRQTIGPGSTQRRSTSAVPRANQTVGLE